MHYQTIHTSPSDRPKFDFLQTHNYLNEFNTELDKARVRANLGIPDEYTLSWGNIHGTIENLSDLIALITLVQNNIGTSISPYATRISTLESNVESINTNLTNKDNTIISNYNTLNTKILSVLDDISELKTDVALNAYNIAHSSGGSSSLDLSSYATLSWVSSLGYLKSTDLGNYITTSQISSYATLDWVTSQILLALAADTLISISCEDISFNVNGTGTLRVIGKYSKSSDKELNYSDYTCSGYDSSLITITNGVISATLAGSTTITISSGTVSSITINVTINSSQQTVTYPLYIGFATSETLIFENATFKVDTISGTWNSSNMHTYGNADLYGIFIITTQDIKSITLGSFSLDLNQTKTLTHSTNGLTYKVYMPGTTTDPSSVEFKIELN